MLGGGGGGGGGTWAGSGKYRVPPLTYETMILVPFQILYLYMYL